MQIIGKDDSAMAELRKKLESLPQKPVKKVSRFNQPPPDDFSPEDDFFTSKPKKKKPDPKFAPGLNCNDMYFVFKKLWREYKFPGNCIAWTMRDRKNIKDLIAEQGEETVIIYLKYCLRNWKELCHRYKIMAICPSVPILYGFRRSLLPEALEPNKKQTHVGAEFTETDIQSGSWGPT